MKTKRIQENGIMPIKEKKAFSKIIRTMPWLYSPILKEVEKVSWKTLCDVACGDGYLLELINKMRPGLNLSGNDIDGYFVGKASQELPFKFEEQDAFKMKEKYDIITLNLSLHHIEDPERLITHLLSKANKALIIADQIRPETEEELEIRLEKRKELAGNRVAGYYDEHGRASILEAYSEEEILEIFKSFNCELKILDEDYYKRFVCVIKKF